jgi:hypothetical protein
MWLAPGIVLPRILGTGHGELRFHRGFGGVDVEVAGARMLRIFGQRRFEHAVQRLMFGALTSRGAAARLEQEHASAIQRDGIEVVGILSATFAIASA